MLQFCDLQFHPPEVVYSWQDPNTGKIRMWAIDRLNKWLETAGLEVFKTPIQPHMAEMFLRDRGVERHRVEKLLNDTTSKQIHLLRPIIIMTLNDGSSTPHLTLDGHHRYVAMNAIRQRFILMYNLTEEQAEPFEITGHPGENGEKRLNVNSFSGLGLD